jgi:hypothetical protein
MPAIMKACNGDLNELRPWLVVSVVILSQRLDPKKHSPEIHRGFDGFDEPAMFEVGTGLLGDLLRLEAGAGIPS